jgi:hypothetical protein
MQLTLKFARRAARLRAIAATCGISFAVLACDAEDAGTPTPLEAETPAATELESPALASSLSAPGIPFGDFHLPTGSYGAPYTGSLLAIYESSAQSALNYAKSKGMRVVVSMAGAKQRYKNANGTFSLSKWKARVAAFRNVNFNALVDAGTVVGHYLVDEPFCAGCWGGKKITVSEIEEMGRYSKSLWSKMPTAVRATPTKLGNTRYRYLDFAWAQWEGPLHGMSFKLTPQQFRDREIGRAQSLGLGLVFGLNYLDGGDGSSRINGTFHKDPNPRDNMRCPRGQSCYRYQMSAAEVRNVGAVLADASYGCALLSWKHNSTFLNRSGMKDAIRHVSNVARNRSRRSCNT